MELARTESLNGESVEEESLLASHKPRQTSKAACVVLAIGICAAGASLFVIPNSSILRWDGKSFPLVLNSCPDVIKLKSPWDLKNIAHGNYLGMDPGNDAKVYGMSGKRVSDWERFDVIIRQDGSPPKISLQSVAHRNYLGMNPGNDAKVYGMSGKGISAWEEFWVYDRGCGKISLKNAAHGNWLGSDPGDNAHVYGMSGKDISPWEEFEVEAADVLIGIDFHENDLELISKTPAVLQEVTVDQQAGEGWTTLTYQEVVTRTTSHSESITFEYGVETEFDAGFLVAKSKIRISMSFSATSMWEDSMAVSKTKGVEVKVIAKKGECVHAQATTFFMNLNVPYTMRFKSGRTVDGIWKGVAGEKVFVKYEDC